MLAALAISGLVALAQPPVDAPPHADDPLELELVWHAPPSCPDADAIRSRIRALLPGEAAGEGLLLVEGDVTIQDDGVALVLVSTFHGRSERRELTAPDCGELGEATAVLLAVALEPARAAAIERAAIERAAIEPATVGSRGPAVPEPPRPASSSASNGRVEPGPRAPSPELGPAAIDDAASPRSPTRSPEATPVLGSPRRARGPSGWALRLAAGMDAGGVPPPTGALQAAALLEWPRARAELHGVWLAPRTKADATGRGGTYQVGAAGLRGCGRLFAGAVEFPLCAGVEAGAVRGRGTSGARRIRHGPWLGALLSAGVARAWNAVGIYGAVEALGRVVGSKFLVGDAVIERQWPVSVRILIGIELRGSWIRRAGGQ